MLGYQCRTWCWSSRSASCDTTVSMDEHHVPTRVPEPEDCSTPQNRTRCVVPTLHQDPNRSHESHCHRPPPPTNPNPTPNPYPNPFLHVYAPNQTELDPSPRDPLCNRPRPHSSRPSLLSHPATGPLERPRTHALWHRTWLDASCRARRAGGTVGEEAGAYSSPNIEHRTRLVPSSILLVEAARRRGDLLRRHALTWIAESEERVQGRGSSAWM
jgi:hypothetical protein